MTGVTEAYDFRGRTMVDSAGEKIGKVDELYRDIQGGQPEWALVNTGLFGTKKTFVPIRGASPTGEAIRVSVTKEQVKDAPRIDADEELSEAEERSLFEHYGLPYTTEGTTTAQGPPSTGAPDAEREAMIRSEEELTVGTAKREAGRARLRKYVVTEQVQTTVPVQHEEVRIEREPMTAADRDDALSGAEITEAEQEVTLHEEVPVVEKKTVPKERVRLEKDTVTEQETVTDEVRKERIESDGDAERTGPADQAR
jgi:uncharacterized protein (TIGR02271 family)